MQFDMLPAFYKKRTLIIEAYEICLGSPTQSVSDMDRRDAAAVKFLFAVGAVMDFIKIFFAGIQHVLISKKSTSVKFTENYFGVERVWSAPAWGNG